MLSTTQEAMVRDDEGRNASESSSEELPEESASWQDGQETLHGSIGLGFALWPPTPSMNGPAAEAVAGSSSSRQRSPSVSSTEMGTATPVDLEIPALSRMPSVTIADSPLGRLSSSAGSPSRPRSFLSTMLGRGSRSGRSSAPASPELEAETAVPHSRSSSMPVSAGSPEPRSSSDLWRTGSPSPRSFAARTFANLTRSASVRSTAAPPPLGEAATERAREDPSLQRLYSGVLGETRPPSGEPGGFAKSGLAVQTITPTLSFARHAEPLCGAILDDRYLLIGTSSGLDFLPMPVSGPLPAGDASSKKRRSTRKPLSLIKRTRFKEIILLSERSNILVAIAGRNDHVRVYALDSIRQIIRKRLQEIDVDQGYPIATASDYAPSSASQTASRIARAGRNAGQPKPSPVQISPKPRPHHADPVRAVGIGNHVAGASGASRRELRTRASRDFVAGRRPSASSATTASTRARAHPKRTSSRRSSVASGSRTESLAPGEATYGARCTPSTGSHASPLKPRAPLRWLNASERSSTSCLADFLRDTGPGTHSPEPDSLFADSSAGRSSNDSGPGFSSANDASPAHTRSFDNPDPVQAHGPNVRSIDSPQAYSHSSRTALDAWHSEMLAPPVATASSQSRLENINAESLAPPAPSARTRKRWTFNGFTTTASPTGELVPASSDRTTSSLPDHSEPITAEPSLRHDAAYGFAAPDYVLDTREPGSPTRDQVSPTPRKRRSVCSLPDGTDRRAHEKHGEHAVNLYPTRSSSTLEFLKLARSRNARMIRAIETRKKTYLAILGGEEGDRIELYTGSKQISLSLNRTFVIPDVPRSIELQLQGDDLVDIYLIYADSIFALEPVTVRVREVGIGRDERRPRRRQRDEENSPEEPPVERRPRINSEAAGSDAAAEGPPSYPSDSALRPRRDFSAFQQLTSIPPMPSSILAPSWIIPPLYTDVTWAGEPALVADLLSPISLLSGAALRNNGRPGLFFCSTGALMTTIVTAEGRNVIRSPMRWTAASSPDTEEPDFARHRLETLVLNDTKTAVVRIANDSVQVADLASLSAGEGFIPASTIPASLHARFIYLATHAAGEQLFYVEATASSFAIKCLHNDLGSAPQ